MSSLEFAVAWETYKGLTRKEIAHRLNMAQNQVWQIRKRIDAKLGLTKQVDVALWMLRTTGILEKSTAFPTMDDYWIIRAAEILE